jgi:hypothetical protein
MYTKHTKVKKSEIIPFLFFGCLILIFQLLSCSNSNPSDTSKAGGTTTQTTNGIIAVLRTTDGEPAKNTMVKLRPRDYLYSDTAPKDTNECQNILTNSEGIFKFYLTVEPPYKKTFFISSVSNDSSQGIIIDSIQIETNNTYTDTIWHDYSELEMKETGSIIGLFRGVPDQEGEVGVDTMIIRIYGTDLHYSTLPYEKFEISGLPPFSYDMDISFKTSERIYNKNIVIHENTITYPKEEPFVDPFSFSGMKKIGFNTTSDGVEVKDDVSPKFPLLIRLNSENREDSIIFAHTKIPGSIRFFDKDDRNLDYEIEHWDTLSSPKKAIIWVSIPTIFGNINTQYIKLGYGAQLTDGQDKEDVFDRKYGFEGVWHFNEESGTVVYDATSHKYNGKKVSETDPVTNDQIIGNGLEFDGINDWINIQQDNDFMNNVQSATISFWIFLKSFNCYILHISDGIGTNPRLFISIDSIGKIAIGGNASDYPQIPNKRVTAVEPLELNKWYNICTRINYHKDNISIFVNGDSVLTDGTIQFEKTQTVSTNSKFASIGSDFNGKNGFAECIIDEFRIFRGDRSPSWIKLSYETQRKNTPFFK